MFAFKCSVPTEEKKKKKEKKKRIKKKEKRKEKPEISKRNVRACERF